MRDQSWVVGGSKTADALRLGRGPTGIAGTPASPSPLLGLLPPRLDNSAVITFTAVIASSTAANIQAMPYITWGRHTRFQVKESKLNA